jgi:hypothetical protein
VSGLPWGKFFWKDWLTDPALSVCSLAAQGLWMRMLCIMSMSNPPGHLILPPTRRPESEAKQVARMCHADARQVRPLLDELETRAVFARDNRGIIVSKRMVRDAELSASGRNSANKGWKKRKGEPNGGPNGSGEPNGGPNGQSVRNPMPRTDTDTDSPPTRPRSRSHGKAEDRNGFVTSAAADLETADHAEAGDPPSGSTTVVPITRRPVRC